MYLPIGPAYEQKTLPAPAPANTPELRALYLTALQLSFRLHNPGSHPIGIREKWGQLNQAVDRARYSSNMAPEIVTLTTVSIEVAHCDCEEELRGLAAKLQGAIEVAAPLFEAWLASID